VIVDVNVSLSRWPFRRLPGDEPRDLVARLRKHHVTQAWAGSFDGVFHKDIASANARLAADCRESGGELLIPFGSVNPKLPDWREDLRRCHEQHKMRGIRLHPNYHQYGLDDPVFRELLRLAASRDLVVQVAISMEDERTQHPLMRVPPVEIGPLREVVAEEPRAKVILLNCYPQLPLEKLRPLARTDRVYFDLSMVERVGGAVRLANEVSLERVLFGSHYPLFYLESALLKMREAALTGHQRASIFEGNARRLLAKR
jgi:predicted TIM-barrel fold metal-dependent hydrolase